MSSHNSNTLTELNELRPYVDRYLSLCRTLNMDSTKQNKLMSIPGAAKLLGVARETVDLWLLDPGLPRVLVGRSSQVRLRQCDLFRYLDDKAKFWYKEAPSEGWSDE
ncbi:Helix-turn-helix domain-containing protein [Lactiplantibacillus plajomi]